MTEAIFKKRCEKLYREYLDYKELAQYGYGHLPRSQIEKYYVMSDDALYKFQALRDKHPEFNY